MVIRRTSTTDIIDRILDKGIVIEYQADVSVGGIDTLMTIDARYVVGSIETHLEYGNALSKTGKRLVMEPGPPPVHPPPEPPPIHHSRRRR